MTNSPGTFSPEHAAVAEGTDVQCGFAGALATTSFHIEEVTGGPGLQNNSLLKLSCLHGLPAVLSTLLCCAHQPEYECLLSECLELLFMKTKCQDF